jgi:hypothetical protein
MRRHGGENVRRAALLSSALLACTRGSPSHEPSPKVGTEPSASAAPDPEVELERRTRDVIVANRPRLRACYETALAQDPTLEGKVVLVVEVGQSGKAEHVLEGHREGLSDGVIHCLARVLRTIPFHDGAARTIRIQVPLAFSAKGE